MMILDLTTGKIARYDNVEKLIEGYCILSLRSKLVSVVLGVSNEALDYPGMMTFMLDYSEGYPEMVKEILEMDGE